MIILSIAIIIASTVQPEILARMKFRTVGIAG